MSSPFSIAISPDCWIEFEQMYRKQFKWCRLSFMFCETAESNKVIAVVKSLDLEHVLKSDRNIDSGVWFLFFV